MYEIQASPGLVTCQPGATALQYMYTHAGVTLAFTGVHLDATGFIRIQQRL